MKKDVQQNDRKGAFGDSEVKCASSPYWSQRELLLFKANQRTFDGNNKQVNICGREEEEN